MSARLLLALAAFAALAAGCRDVSYDDEEPGPGPRTPDARLSGGPDASLAKGGTVRAILESRPAKKSAVAVEGVVVVGRVTSSKNAYAWVQDPGGGALSGIQIYCQKENGCAAGYDLIDKLEEGDVIDVSGAYDEFQGAAEIVTPTIVKKGTKIAVAATTVTAAQVANEVDPTATAFARLDQVVVELEGPITVSNVTAESLARDCTSGTGKQYDGFEIEVGGKTVNVGFGFYDTVGWCIASCGFECKQPVTLGAKFDSLRGVLRVVNGMPRIDPPWTASLAVEGGPRPDAGAGTTPDAPVTSVDAPTGPGPGPVGDGTVRSVAINPPADGAAVALRSVVVVAVETGSNSAQAYVQDLGGGEFSGMLLYCGSSCRADLAGLRAGDVIDASGKSKLFGGHTLELTDVRVTPRGTRAEVVALTVEAARVARSVNPTSTEFRPLNGVLVRVAGPLDVTSVEAAAMESTSTCTDGTRYRDGFEAGAGTTSVYVSFFFNDTVGSCVAGGCRACDVGAITTANKLDVLRGVARAQGGREGTVVAVSPTDEIDFPRSRSVRALHAVSVANGTVVTIENAVVVAYNAVTSTTGSLFLQDAGGGRWSGIQLFCTGSTCNAAAKALVPGDVVTVSGKYTRYLGTTPEIETNLAPVKAATPSAVRWTAVSGDALDMAVDATDARFLPYNQAYVKLSGTIAVADLAPEELQAVCPGASVDVLRHEGFQLTDGTHQLLVGDLFAPAYTVCVEGGCDPCANAVTMESAYSAVAGVARVGRGGKIQIAPTSDADLTVPAPPMP